MVLQVLAGDPAATYEAIAGHIGKTRKTASRAIASLKQKGLLYREGSDKVGAWRLR